MIKIYIDMDGVVADFDGGLINLLNIEPKPQNDQPADYAQMMWDAVRNYRDGHFYADLSLIPGTAEAIKLILDKYEDNCEILTGIPKQKRGIIHAAQDKAEWVKKNLSPQLKVNAVIRADKINFCKGSDCILIDDYQKNITEWEAAGGTGILFESWDQTLNELKNRRYL